jgi:hypothetical protein
MKDLLALGPPFACLGPFSGSIPRGPTPILPHAQPLCPLPGRATSSLRAHGSLECRPPLSDPSPSSCLNPAPRQNPRRVFLNQHPPPCGSSPQLRRPCGWEIATTSRRKKNPDSGNHVRSGSPPRHSRSPRSMQQPPSIRADLAIGPAWRSPH